MYPFNASIFGKSMFGWGNFTPFAWLITPLIIWSLFWKGMALWRAARANQTAWYIVLLIVNTVGILEIIYLLAFTKDKLKLSKITKKKSTKR